MRIVSVLVTCIMLAGCMQSGPSPEMIASMQKANKACYLQTTAVARAKCLNAVTDQYIRPTTRDQDLLSLLEAQRIVLAEKIDAGTITQAEADLQMAQATTAANSEQQRRSTNADMAAAATMAAMPHPTTCNSYGYGYGATTTCY